MHLHDCCHQLIVDFYIHCICHLPRPSHRLPRNPVVLPSLHCCFCFFHTVLRSDRSLRCTAVLPMLMLQYILAPVVCSGRTARCCATVVPMLMPHILLFDCTLIGCCGCCHRSLDCALVLPMLMLYPLSTPVDCCSLHFFSCYLLRPLSLLAALHRVVIKLTPLNC